MKVSDHVGERLYLGDNADAFICPFLFLELFWLSPVHCFTG